MCRPDSVVAGTFPATGKAASLLILGSAVEGMGSIMVDEMAMDATDDGGQPAGDLVGLHRAYLSAMRRHRMLVGDLCSTIRHINAAIAEAGLDTEVRRTLSDRIGLHVESARTIIADIDETLTLATATAPNRNQ